MCGGRPRLRDGARRDERLTLPLAGIRVLDLSRLLPGPYATMVLGDLGAEVWKLEAPDGDPTRWVPPTVAGESALFLALNRNKRSLILDLKRTEGRAALLRLARAADVVVESFRPGRAAELGLCALLDELPRLVLCSINGFGATGALAARAGHDLGYEAWSGLLSAPNGPDRAPAMPATPIADLVGGAWPAVTAIVAALFGRERTGRGTTIEIAIRDGAVAALPVRFANLAGARAEPSELTGALPAYNVYRTKDDRFLALSALEPKFWDAFCRALERPQWISRQFATGRDRERLFGELRELFASRTRSEWEKVLDGVDACIDPVLTPSEVRSEATAIDRGLFVETSVGRERIALPASPIVFDSERLPLRLPPPALGEHTATILEAAGFSRPDVDALAREGITKPRGRLRKWLWGKVAGKG